MKKIYPKEWMELHPYGRTDNVDQYYTRIANRIQECIYLTGIGKELEDDEEDKEDIHHISLCLAAWFEDVVSATGIWQAFTTECRKRYGTCLPFYPIADDYYPDEPNLEDIRFLLWHHIQFLRREKGSTVNPENSAIEQTATLIYKLLTDEYETAPENERMQEYLLNQSFGKEDFFEYRAVLEWFHYCCYFNIENLAEYAEEMEVLAEKGDEEELSQQYITVMSQARFSNLAFDGRLNLLSLTTPEWLARILKNNSQPAGLLEKVKQREQSYYLYEGEDDKYIYLSDLCQDEEKLKVNKISMNLFGQGLADRIAGKTIFVSIFVSYGDTWWQCGALAGGEINPHLEDLIRKQTEKNRRTFIKQGYCDFMRGSGGKPFVFCRTATEMQAFLADKVGYKEAKYTQMPDEMVKDKEGFLLTASPINGNRIMTEELACIKSPDNPFYDKKIAERRAFLFMLDPQVSTYDFSCILQDMNLLPDAKLNSAKGEEHGHRLLHDNAQFLTDYFHHCCREKDFPSEEESNEWKKKSSKGILSLLK